MGFDGLFFGRLDYADKDKRLETKTMEMMWKGKHLGKKEKLTIFKSQEEVFLVWLETSWEWARNELHNDCPLYLVPSWERARSQLRPQNNICKVKNTDQIFLESYTMAWILGSLQREPKSDIRFFFFEDFVKVLNYVKHHSMLFFYNTIFTF